MRTVHSPSDPPSKGMYPHLTTSIAFECVRHDLIDLGTSLMMLGRVASVSIEDGALAEDGLPEFGSLLPPSCLGRHEWGYAPRIRRLPRPTE